MSERSFHDLLAEIAHLHFLNAALVGVCKAIHNHATDMQKHEQMPTEAAILLKLVNPILDKAKAERSKPMTLTPKQVEDYVKDHGAHCPHCQSPRIINFGATYGVGTRLQQVKCDGCARVMTETYNLTHVT